ncbi:caspase-8 [Anopheles ziemanni]|uniref:caspase-8 n=1 Tax=Anopheles coustani TaxID=139045 RepID=UPI00265A9753|nr:caspase-8 [Anopheles coustani]XP_058174759.1 caspase-8 [Anopheles ziemanni]
MTVQLSQEDVNFIENELSYVDKVSLIFLLYGQRNPQYALQILNVSGRMLSDETSFLVDWTNYERSTSWEDELLEALTILEQNLLLLRAGFDDDELRSKYFPQTAEIALHVHPILKGLYQFCERLEDKTTLQLIKQLKQHLGNASVPQDCLEIVLLHLISNETIILGSRASGKECDLVALTAACKSAELYDESDFLKGISQHYNSAVKAEQQVQSDASSKNYPSVVQQPVDVVEALTKMVVTKTKTSTLECYEFDPQRAGIMLLVNQFRFYRETNPELVHMIPSKALKDRKGTEVDKNALVQLFTDLGYEIILEENITHHQIVQAVQHAVQRIRPAHCSLVVGLLSHGQEGIVYGSNSVPVEVKSIQHLMASERLTGKPKLLIVQACQGSDLQSAVPVPTYERDSLDSDDRTASVFMDFLVAWSTVPGFASIRHVEKGSWFIQELCTKLRQLYKSEQIMDILTSVINDVSSKRGYGNECMVPIIQSTLSKRLYFRKQES